MTKQQLIIKFARESEMPFNMAKLVVETVFKEMIATLENNDRVEIRGFGTFDVKDYRGYTGRNPKTGERVYIKPKRMPFFRVGKELKERLNNGNSRQ
jgi:integration host factor subunit beta